MRYLYLFPSLNRPRTSRFESLLPHYLKNFISLFLLVVISIPAPLRAQAYTTHPYQDTLQLDLFRPTAQDSAVPLVLFVHGGGFSGGHRRAGHTLGSYLAERGIACASITYTLYMRGRTQDWGCDGILPEKLKTLQVAANDTWHATAFLLENAERFGIDPEKIFLAGSSAGAEAILHAAYYDREVMALADHGLPKSFRYAGLASGAGAIQDLNFITADNAIPTIFFHGDQDPLVPYGTAAHHFCRPDQSGWLMLFGSASIADHLEKVDGSFILVTHEGAGHEIAGRYFRRDLNRMVDFVDWVGRGAKFRVREVR